VRRYSFPVRRRIGRWVGLQCISWRIGATLYVTIVTCHRHFWKWWWLSPPLFFKVENKKIPIFPYTLGKRIVFFLLPEVFCVLKYAENAVAAGDPPRTPLGELTTLPQTPSRLGSGHPSLHPTPLGAFGASMLAPSAPRSSCPPDTKSWRRHWLCALRKDFTQRKHRVKL